MSRLAAERDTLGLHCPYGNQVHVLTVHPENELVFSGPFYRPSVATVIVTNPTKMRVVFCMKTTAPKRFLVNPVTNLVEPGASCMVKFMMFPNVANTDICNHKFRMLSVVVMGHGNLRHFEKVWVISKPEHIMVDHWVCRYDELEEPSDYESFFSPRADPPVTERPGTSPNPEEIEMLVQITELKVENKRLRQQSEQLILYKLEKKMQEGKQARKRKTLIEKLQVNLRDGLLMGGVNTETPCVKNVILNDKVLIMCCCAALFICGLLLGRFFF